MSKSALVALLYVLGFLLAVGLFLYSCGCTPIERVHVTLGGVKCLKAEHGHNCGPTLSECEDRKVYYCAHDFQIIDPLTSIIRKGDSD